MSSPVIQTTVVGSYPVPLWLRVISNRDALRDAMLVVIKTQEQAGIDVVSDGELYRWDVNHAETNGMIDYFVRQMDGVQTVLNREQLKAWRARSAMGFRAKPPGIVTGPLGAGTLDLQADYSLFRGLTQKRTKFTVTSPYMLAKTVVDEHYGSLEKLTMAFAEVLAEQVADLDCDVVQIDEANVTGSAHDGPLVARAINRVLQACSGPERAVHLCYGNYGGQTIQTGTYQALIAFLNALEADHLVLELARRPEQELELLREVEPRIGIGLGVVDIKDNEVESPAVIARRIERAAAVLGVERIKYVHPDCGFWMLPRSVADPKMAALVRGRDAFLGS